MKSNISKDITNEENKRSAKKFWAEKQEQANTQGMDIYEYMSKTSGGLLDGVMKKLKLHAEAHPFDCPPDCEFQASLKRLKKKYESQD